MVWLGLASANVSDEEFVKIAKEEGGEGGIKVSDGRIVLHHRKCLSIFFSYLIHLFIIQNLKSLKKNSQIASNMTISTN